MNKLIAAGLNLSCTSQNRIMFGVYIHWPYCLSKCPYCDFNTYVAKTIDESGWLSGIIHEIKRHPFTQEVTTVFFGGGTPSLMHPKSLEQIIDAIPNLASDVEITLEANPNSVEIQKLHDFKKAGINRISVGIQALNDKDLKFLGRTHSVQEAYHAIENALSTFNRVSFDLIYARPDQTLDAWEKELTEMLTFGSEHLSLYQLTIEPNTQFFHLYNNKQFYLPEVTLAEKFYRLTHDIMTAHNRPAYEVSNYGKKCLHNMGYWLYHDYLGVGPGAHGRITLNDKRYRTEQIRAPELWHKAVEEKGTGDKICIELTENEQKIERTLLGLRLFEGIALPDHLPQEKLAHLQQAGFIELSHNHIKPTLNGILCLNSVLEYLLT